MRLKISSPEDFWSGVMFIAFGALAIYVSRDYPIGSAMRMGPGYFPTAIGICLIALGLVITAIGFRANGEGIGKWPWRGMFVLSVGFATYAWGIDNLGFIPSLAVLIGLVSIASTEFRWKEVLISMVVLIGGCWLVFIKGLELPYPLFWWSY